MNKIKPVHKYDDKPYDEAYEVSQDLSVAESYDGRGKVSDQFILNELTSFSTFKLFFLSFFLATDKRTKTYKW